MRKLPFLLLLASSLPAFAAKPVTPDMVDELLKYAQGKSDAKVADQLFDLELTKRASSVRLARWQAELPGPKSRQALVALADASVFLRLPQEEIPAAPAPERAAQDSLLALTRKYVTESIPKLPNFFATRDTTFFSNRPELIDSVTLVHPQFQEMHLVGISNDKVYFREGKEVVVAVTSKQSTISAKSLSTQGIFGQAMKIIFTDVLPSGPVWSHWEGSADAPIAIFSYAVPEAMSHYGVGVGDAAGLFQPNVAYHGEIAIDPADGAIRRLTAVADLKRNSPVTEANVMVEYGPVDIGHVSYICPIRSVSLSITRTSKNSPGTAVSANTGPNSQNTNSGPDYRSGYNSGFNDAGPLLTELNDVQFSDYHRFRAESRILTGNDTGPDAPGRAGPAPNSTSNP